MNLTIRGYSDQARADTMRSRMSFHCAMIFALLALSFPAMTVGQAIKVIPKGMTSNASMSTLSVSASPSQVSFKFVSRGTASGNSPVSITTAWTGLSSGGTINLYGYFISVSAALTGSLSTAAIPSSAISGQMTTGLPTSYTAFTQTNPLGGAGASLELFSTGTGSGSGSRTDALNLTIDLSTLPELPADTYTGTLVIQAQEF